MKWFFSSFLLQCFVNTFTENRQQAEQESRREMSLTKALFAATGDSMITRRLPLGDQHSQQIADLIGSCDIRFTNLEVTVHRSEGFPSAQSGGTWAMAPPEVLDDLDQYKFNMLAWANNHTLDYSYGGLQATAKYLDQAGFVHAGVGNHLAEASAVKYVECANGRVALIAATSSFHESWAAGAQRPDMAGRPGVNPLRYETIHRVSRERMNQLRQIAEICEVNAKHNLMLKEGFAVADAADGGKFRFGNYLFEEDTQEGVVTRPNLADMKRMIRAIEEAKRQADYVLVSIHSHEMKGEAKDQPADFLITFARECIDAGAHAIIGHGPHILRGVELYKGRPIFYSLGNFIFQNDTVTNLPADFYEKYGLGHDHNTADALDTRSANDTRGLGVNPQVWSSVIARWSMEQGELRSLQFIPIDLGFGLPKYRRGWPSLTRNEAILEELQQLSRPFGTDIKIANGIGEVKL